MIDFLNEFCKVAGYKINFLKLVAFFIPIMTSQKEKLRQTSHLQLHQKIKYLKLTKDVNLTGYKRPLL